MKPSVEHIINQIKGDFFVIVDGGARNGTKEVTDLHPLSVIFAFEPSKDAFKNLKNNVSGNHLKPGDVINYPVALTNKNEETILNITMRPGGSSTLFPDAEYLSYFKLDNWSEIAQIVSQESVPGMRLDTFMQKNNIKHIDLLKLDTQGNELDILQSGSNMIDNIEVIKTEVELVKMYKNQPLFHDISNFLYSRNFELIDIQWTEPCKRFHARSDLDPGAYRLIWADAIYARNIYDSKKPRHLSQAIILAEMGYHDIAIYQIRNSPVLNENDKETLENYYANKATASLKKKIKKYLMKYFSINIERRALIDKQVVSLKENNRIYPSEKS